MLKERTNYFLKKKEDLSLKAAKIKELKTLAWQILKLLKI